MENKKTTPSHTPAPWYIEDEQSRYIIRHDVMYVAEVVKESKEDEANATLIASAPELLEALEWIVDQYVEECWSCDGTGEPQTVDYERCGKCEGQGEVVRDSVVCETHIWRKLIAKAKGE